MRKPTYYLWKSDFQTADDLKQARKRYEDLGFRTVTYQDGQNERNIHEALKALIKNHYMSD